MSGIYSRKNYDNSYYPILKNMTEGGGNHAISLEKIDNNYCINNNVPMASRAAFMSKLDYKNINSIVDLESHLKNLDLTLSNEINGRTLTERNQISKQISDKIIKEDCNVEEFLDINTRLDNPPIFIRETTLSRFDFPIIPHTSYYYNGYENTMQIGNNRSGVNTRLVAKDIAAKQSLPQQCA